MFLTKLLVGNANTMGQDKLLTAPPIDPVTGLKYNTVVGTTGGSKVWIVYENGRAYPDYLVRYYRGKRDAKRTPFESKHQAMRSNAKRECNGATQSQFESKPQAMRSDVEWEYVDNLVWRPYGDAHKLALEDAYQSQQSKVHISSDVWAYEVDLGKMLQTNVQHPAHTTRPVRRRELSGVNA
jgi:hypothetical protein